MFCPVNPKYPMHLDSRCSRGSNFALDVVRTKTNLRIARAFEDVLVHFSIAALIAGLSAGRIEHNLAPDFLRRRIEVDFATL